MLCAKSYMGAHCLRMRWCSHDVTKDYIALVNGRVDPNMTAIRKRIYVDNRVKNSKRPLVPVTP